METPEAEIGPTKRTPALGVLGILPQSSGEALYHVPGKDAGRLECRPQKPARDCNERSLLRRFGAGIKILTIVITEKYTAYREHSTQATSTAMTFDGGVGGFEN